MSLPVNTDLGAWETVACVCVCVGGGLSFAAVSSVIRCRITGISVTQLLDQDVKQLLKGRREMFQAECCFNDKFIQNIQKSRRVTSSTCLTSEKLRRSSAAGFIFISSAAKKCVIRMLTFSLVGWSSPC